MITVVVPHRTGQPRAWRADRAEMATGVQVRMTLAGKPVTVEFLKGGLAWPRVAQGESR